MVQNLICIFNNKINNKDTYNILMSKILDDKYSEEIYREAMTILALWDIMMIVAFKCYKITSGCKAESKLIQISDISDICITLIIKLHESRNNIAHCNEDLETQCNVIKKILQEYNSQKDLQEDIDTITYNTGIKVDITEVWHLFCWDKPLSFNFKPI